MDKNPNNEHNRFEENENAEYGVEQMMANEEDMEEARKHSQYHLSQDQLEHKRDDIRQAEQ